MLLFSALIRLVTVVMLDLLNTEQLPVVNVYFCHNNLTVVITRTPSMAISSAESQYEILLVSVSIPASSEVTLLQYKIVKYILEFGHL